jgi:hypothetical protein
VILGARQESILADDERDRSGCWTRAASEGTAPTSDRPVDLLSQNNVFDIDHRSV